MNLMIDLHNTSPANHQLQIDRSALYDLLRTAHQQACEMGRPVLASYSQPLPQCNLLAAFDCAGKLGQDTAFYWEWPAGRHTLVGIGEATTRAAESIGEIASHWRNLTEQALIYPEPDRHPLYPWQLAGPLCFSGFAFDTASVRTTFWQNFPDGLLILPAMLIGTSGTDTFLTVNTLISVGDTDDRIADEVIRAETLLFRLSGALERPVELAHVARPQRLTIRDLQPQSAWWRMVEATTAAIQNGAYRKVVLARSVEARAPEPFSVSTVLADLGRRYSDAYIFALSRGGHTFLGASPERLARVADGRVETMALAGSAPRGTSSAEDARLGKEMLRQDKTHNEHTIVAQMICEALAPLTTAIHASEQPQLLQLRNVQHLLTPITGELVPGTSALEVVAALHPTPAVAGEPREDALSAIRANEQLDRGWYAGPIGWIGADGSGEFAVALRSAFISGNQATLFAGCGIVAGSDPQSEYNESCWKLQVMLQSLGGED